MVDDLVARALAQISPRSRLKVVDLGGGTGGQAVRLASAGHDVTVVDPSPDALAAVARRAAEAGLQATGGGAGTLQGVLGDAETVAESLGSDEADLVLCHGVLEFVEDPAVALASIASVLEPHGLLSLRVAQRDGSMLASVVKGHLRHAHALAKSPDGQWGPDDPLRRRFSPGQIAALLSDCGFRVHAVAAVGMFSEVAPPLESEYELDLLEALNDHGAQQETLLAIAPALHVTAEGETGSGP